MMFIVQDSRLLYILWLKLARLFAVNILNLYLIITIIIMDDFYEEIKCSLYQICHTS